jgi:cytochrome b6-f complex iron-sulfur subunit
VDTPSRREVLQIGAACCLTAAAGCDAGTAIEASGTVVLGSVSQLTRELESLPGKVKHLAKHKVYLVLWEPEPGKENDYSDSAGGFLALTERCPHLGCRLPLCESSEWFECPCHGSRFNRAGEYRFGPAPHGQPRYRLSVEKTSYGVVQLVLHLDEPVQGAPRGTLTMAQESAGPHCVG